MNPGDAIRIIAVVAASERVEAVGSDWENWPLIGEYDWEEIVATALLLVGPLPTAEAVREAYDLLESQANA